MMVFGKGGLLKTVAMFGICVRFLVCKISRKKLEDSLTQPTNIYIVKHLSSVTTFQVTSHPVHIPAQGKLWKLMDSKSCQLRKIFWTVPVGNSWRKHQIKPTDLQNRSISFSFSDGRKGQLKETGSRPAFQTAIATHEHFTFNLKINT